jgi:hypothetical protein
MAKPGEIAGIIVAIFLTIVTTPAFRQALSDMINSSSPMAVAMTVCRAEADVGADIFGGCMHKAIPNLPPAWPAPQEFITN